MMRLLITDLDNTLYDWVSFFARAFEAMAAELITLLGTDKQTLFEEFKLVHRKYDNSEYPFAIFELPSVRRRFGDLPAQELKAKLDGPLHAFNSARKREMRLYESVAATLEELKRQGITIIGHTEALAVNASFRLHKLGIDQYFRRLYALEAAVVPMHPDPDRAAPLLNRPDFIQLVPRNERKPNPRLLSHICAQEQVEIKDAWYVGDSLSRDILMAQEAGVTSVWAEYGTRYDHNLWNTLVKITHWTDEDVVRDAELRRQAKSVQPNFTIQSFSEILTLMNQK
ncbi:HAD hydrolase-like protein [Vitiosangium sp. GDMCC 1.1324]|uniref:HAD hydrolase-like protein n=1 Tax=Vitiosangium sp. (strain GDMCC 1.1324) TaxID=2138576 RepID=UPI000D36748F|nr:HAD hydrolase-like protein [Vitiosangium sp. GDMCC 1.1324]PTL84250.1 haloacid dehalogenase [Vitiosangium sp. GDMCC 1.1324]